MVQPNDYDSQGKKDVCKSQNAHVFSQDQKVSDGHVQSQSAHVSQQDEEAEQQRLDAIINSSIQQRAAIIARMKARGDKYAAAEAEANPD